MPKLIRSGPSYSQRIYSDMNKDTRTHLIVYAILLALASAEAVLLWAIYTMDKL